MAHSYKPKWIEPPSLVELRDMVVVALGLSPAELILSNATLVDVVTSEIIEGVSVAIHRGRVAAVIEDKPPKIKALEAVDLKGMYIAPAFIDAHVHLESSFLSPAEFSVLAEMHGTSVAVVDPHEVANVGGKQLVELFAEMIAECADCIKFLVQVPSCVPPTEDSWALDTPGSELTLEEISDLIELGFKGVGEVMDYEALLRGSERLLDIIRLGSERGLRIYGHLPLDGEAHVNAYFSTGISSDHEVSTPSGAISRLRRGVYTMVRGGGAWRDVNRIIPELSKKRVDTRRLILVSDDISVTDLVERGYMDSVIREAIESGLDPVRAIQAATINPAEYLRIDDYVGLIAPGRWGDIVVLRNLEKIEIFGVLRDGRIRVWNGAPLITRTISQNTLRRFVVMNVSTLSTWRRLTVEAPKNAVGAVVRAIEVEPGRTTTRFAVEELPVVDGYVASDPEHGVLHLAVIDRYGGGSAVGRGFIKGVSMRGRGAVAQTYAHDTHNIVVVGSDPRDMFEAVEALKRIGGGIVVVADGIPVAHLELEIGGVMSSKRWDEVYRSLKDVERAFEGLTNDAAFDDFFLTLSLISLTVIPEARLTTRGLLDVNSRRFVDVVLKYIHSG